DDRSTVPVLRSAPPLTLLSPSSSSGSSGSFSSSSSIPEQFSAHFMFLSLVLRIWFCQRLCNPVMVRPLVLYPVLVLTVVWDRYLLSVLSEKISVGQRSGVHGQSRMGRMRKIETGQREQSGPGGESTEEREKKEEGRAGSRATNETQVLRRRLRPRSQEGPGSESEDEEAKDDDDDDKEGEVEGYSGECSKAVWQALLSGIVVQLVWIGAIRVFSRSGLCMM
ncbi:hypothetical protein BGZ92_003490, partial [Podila epicladia]